KGDARARAVLVEQVDEHPAAQRLLHPGVLAPRRPDASGALDEFHQLVRRPVVQVEQVAAQGDAVAFEYLGHCACSFCSGAARSKTASAPSVSRSRTRTLSPIAVGTFLPT